MAFTVGWQGTVVVPSASVRHPAERQGLFRWMAGSGRCKSSPCTLRATSAAGEHLTLTGRTVEPHHATLTADAGTPRDRRFALSPQAPHPPMDWPITRSSRRRSQPARTSGTTRSRADSRTIDFLSGQEQTRLVSNFVIYPKTGLRRAADRPRHEDRPHLCG